MPKFAFKWAWWYNVCGDINNALDGLKIDKMETVEEKAMVYVKKLIVLENRYKFSNEANLRVAEYYAYKAYLAGYNQGVKDLSENKFNPDDYECLAGVCPDLSDEDHCETCTLKKLKKL